MTTSTPVIVQLPLPGASADPLRAAAWTRDAVAAAAELGAEAVLIPHGEEPALDPTVLAGLLSADGIDIPLIVEARTGGHAPFNLARRLQTLARITGGRAGLYLRDTGVDPVTAASRPGAAAASAVLGEYVRVLRRLWDSFPESALLGDRDAGLFADVDQIAPARHRGETYGVEGALNVPIAPGRRPVVLVDAESLDGDAPVDAVVSRTGTPLAGASSYRPLVWRPAAVDAGFAPGAAPPSGGVLLRIDASPAETPAHLEAALDALVHETGRGAGPAGDGALLQRLRTASAAAA
ncbi:LLM class flavin-dependent oxidoreductase [Microbacterium betulae]|uniref:LLM class flavin-dependent oxidoreductase n=1 Tax=Microbacterium betulae TaxID=2981139 RepID=A0AA97I7C3_9MICO|nr:LLM class flavin-dependent oxidoreductase [Microbacterium sp. AB]WOF23280.1 LLM class flavin-dependent oxidoreductase [Microbacterium sp. AB]